MAFNRWRFNKTLPYWQQLYEHMTPSELALEPAVAALGRRYRVQHPFWGMSAFADFALPDDKVIIEVDGPSHDKPAQKEKDLIHEMKWQALGWRVVRVTNSQAQADPEGTIRAALTEAASPGRSQEALQAALDQLRRDYPALLAAAAKRPKRGRPVGPKTLARRQRAAEQAADPPRKRASRARGQA